MSSGKPGFSVRIVVCDHYLAKPIPGIDVIYSEFRGSDIKQVPVLRIFGSAPDGNKACIHIHGVFPYFYIPCPNPNPAPQFLYQIAASLDKALNIALKQASSANQHVYKITLVKGLPFYGFHSKEHLYLKIFLYNPGLVKQAVELCSNGAILGQTLQPHESHLNFTLQFFIDFNLFGMSNIDIQTVKFRKLLGNSQESDDIIDSPQDYVKAESVCHYEADCIASHIINRQRVGRGDGIENPGLEEVWNQENERRKQLNMSIASKSLSQTRLNTEETDSHYKYEKIFKIKLSGLAESPVHTGDVMKALNDVHYPAESMEGSQLFNAVDVSMHLPDSSLGASFNTTLKWDHDETFTQDPDVTLVDENLALNSTLPRIQYSQVVLDNEDMDLVGILQGMEENSIEEDSVMGTPDVDNVLNSDDDNNEDAEYSQIFHEDTIVMKSGKSKIDEDCSWNDSFWDGANIPQLDGTFDDDHVKKVRKRKMRPFKLGLSKPKKKQDKKGVEKVEIKEEPVSNLDISVPDEINESRETVNSVSNCHLKKTIKIESNGILGNIKTETNVFQVCNESITDLVNKAIAKYEKPDACETYDLKNKFEPVAGPSTSKTDDTNLNKLLCPTDDEDEINNSYESSPERRDLGFVSFYNKSKIFDVTTNDNDSERDCSMKMADVDLEEGLPESHVNDYDTTEDIKLRYSDTTQEGLVMTSIKKCTSTVVLTPKFRPPTNSYIEGCLEKYNIPKVNNSRPYYSNHKDAGDKLEIGHMVLKLQSKASQHQKQFEKVLDITSIEEWRQLFFLQTNEMSEESSKPENLKTLLAGNKQCVLEPLRKPPTNKDVVKWFSNIKCDTERNRHTPNQTEILIDDDEIENSQAIGLNEDEINSSLSLESVDKDKSRFNKSLQVTMQPDGSFLCFGQGDSEKEIPDTPLVEMNFLTVMLIEVHTSTRGELNPDPLLDPIKAVFITVTNDCPRDHFLQKSLTEVIVADDMPSPKYVDRCVSDSHITYVKDESEIILKVIESVRKHDPDILCGYDVEMNSWGYFLERSEALGVEIVMEISRVTEKYRQKRWRSEEKDFESRIIGRVMLNVWRLFKHELALSSYSFENCMYEILKERVPKYSYAQLSDWWNEESRILRWIPVEYYLTRLSGTVRMLEKLDIINRTAELARLFGLQWREVLTRGSQFRVESLMLRAARPLNLIALSPTVKQRAAMRAPECLPLIFEPESRFYSDPVIVLDFQSLYPSMMIAYNYCFSTCIGRVQNITSDTAYEFGAWRLRVPKAKLEALVDNGLVHWSPVGVGFVKSSVRRGVLPALLRRILAARQAVKKNMKMQTDEAVKKAMHSRQLGLKLIANVTYGYTAANFSGRMPCVEVGDSVVAKGRETLERAIKLLENNPHWNAKVIYGDTDSMFVLVPGGSRADAFRVGALIADAVTADNPPPVALKLEKVYQPCILQTKKRYVGYMYESAEQQHPVYEAKGIETVRRDGCPAGVKLLQRSLCELFSSGDMSKVKRLVTEYLSRLVDGNLPLHELFFTREYRPNTTAPPTEIAKRLISRDRRASPRIGERISWLITAGAPNLPLLKLARSPEELRKNPMRPHISYYVTRAILPPLHRCLSLMAVDVFKWWSELGFVREIQNSVATGAGGIARYLWRERCALCGHRSTRSICDKCAGKPQRAVAALCCQLNMATSHVRYSELICVSCCGHNHSEKCDNTECPVLWRRHNATLKLSQVQDIIKQMPTQLKCVESIDF